MQRLRRAIAPLVFVLLSSAAPGATSPFAFQPGDRVCLLGGALAERQQHHGWLETRLQARFPDLGLSFRNLGFSGDELTVQQRTQGFGTWDDYLARCRADVVFGFFGYNESFAGEDGIGAFRRDLAAFIDHTRAQRYNGSRPPRIVLFTPIPYEHGHAHLQDTDERNALLRAYVKAMIEVARSKGVPLVDLYHPMRRRYAAARSALTINGIHLTEEGDRQLAEVIENELFLYPDAIPDPARLERIRALVLEKNLLWFNRYRATDGYNVYGGRSSLRYEDGITNFAVLQREMEILDAMCRNRDRAIWDLARGGEGRVDDADLPPKIRVRTNKPGPLKGGAHPYPSGEEAIAHMTTAPGMRVTLFADESRFPELANPVQMAFDTRGRLWVAAWPTYPHWEPGEPMCDRLLILEDDDGDGSADRCIPFADDLHNPTGFEFWNGGVIVANCPDLLFLRDTDGDDRADDRERILHGLSSADTHHSANSFVFGPDGALYFQEGTFHHSQIETLDGPERCHNACVWRFDPRTWEVDRYVAYNFANPHGHVFDRFGQDFVTDGTGNVNYYALPFSGRVVHPDKHGSYFPFFQQRSRPAAATEILSSSHFPPENQGNYLICNVIGFQGIFQYEVHDDGSGFKGVEVDPIVFSDHPTFRPSDVEVGPDGAIYFLDWTNAIIGHMQHHLRDPNRDHTHGRVYRVTFEGRPLSTPPRIHGRPVPELLELLKHPDDRVRYRVRIELSNRDPDAVRAAIDGYLARIDPGHSDFEHHRLEALWAEQRVGAIDRTLLRDVLASTDPRVRAAATRVVRFARKTLADPLEILARMAGDDHPRVRLEAVVAASEFDDLRAVDVALSALEKPTDRFLRYALDETMRTLAPVWKSALAEGRPVAGQNPEGVKYLLSKVTPLELLKLPRIEPVLEAILTRHGVDVGSRRLALSELASARSRAEIEELLGAIERLDASSEPHAAHVVSQLGELLQDLAARSDGREAEPRLRALVENANKAETARVALAALATVTNDIEAGFSLIARDALGLERWLRSIPLVQDPDLRLAAYERVRRLMFRSEPDGAAADDPFARPGVQVTWYETRLRTAEPRAFEGLAAAGSLRSDRFTVDLPGVHPEDAFALRFEGTLHVARDGTYEFAVRSDDGSMLFVDGRLVVDNDGDHGMVERSGRVELEKGAHDLLLTYYDQGGGEGLQVSWSGPGFSRRPLEGESLTTDRARSVREAAILAMASIPGHAGEKLMDVARLIGEGDHLAAAAAVVEAVDLAAAPPEAMHAVVLSIAATVSGLDKEQRTRADVLAALQVGQALARALPEDLANEAFRSLEGLGGSTILIRTVPHQMLYDRAYFNVVAGEPVAIVFQNNDVMPHNLVITRPGAMETVGKAAEALSGEPDSPETAFIPDTPDVLWHTPLLNPGETYTLRFVAPAEVADHPYVCTFPGHWRVMNGVMRVFATRAEKEAAGEAPVIADREGAAPPRRFVKLWKMQDLAPRLDATWRRGRDLERGARLFDEAGCAKCHSFADDAVRTGPPLAGIGEKYDAEGLLREILKPSSTVLEGYSMHLVETRDGNSVLGRIVSEDARSIRVIPYMKDEQDAVTIPIESVRSRTPHAGSPMPEGLLVTLNQEEILDLLAYLMAGESGS